MKWRIAFLIVFFISLGFHVYLFARSSHRFLPGYGILRINPSDKAKYPLLSERILSEQEKDILINFLPLRNKLEDYADKQGDNFSLYFEYLRTGTSIRVNEHVQFLGGSLMKLPVVMAYYRWKEDNDITTAPIVIIRKENIDKNFGDLWKRGAGARISLDEAATLALTRSDNTAANVVYANLSKDSLNPVYTELDLDLKTEYSRVLMDVEGYSSILKALYYSSVLHKRDSQAILATMTETAFSKKLPAGVPSSIPVAHKIGVVSLGGESVYSDCGIVYAPNRPYILCMATLAPEDEANTRMKTASKMVYDFISSTTRLSSR